MTSPATIVDALGGAGHRLTRPRRAVAELIAAREGHFTSADLVADVRSRRLGVGRATIFRTLELLDALHIIERLDLPTGGHAYVPCDPVHHHHLVCSRCRRIVDVDDGRLDAVVRGIARRTGYRIDEHRLELFGLCPACRAVPGDSR